MGISLTTKRQQSGADATTQANVIPISDTARIATDTGELVRIRAFELYEEGSRIDGRDVEDWLRAEAEIRDAVRKQAA